MAQNDTQRALRASQAAPELATTRLNAILEQLSGHISVLDACAKLGVDESAFEALKARALAAMDGVHEAQPALGPKAAGHPERQEDSSRAWLECSPVCTKIVDLDFNLQYMSRSGVEALKIDDITQFYGCPYPLPFYPNAFREQMIASLKRVKISGEVVTQEAPLVDVEGGVLWFHSTLVPVCDDEGQLDYIMVVSLDTTERKNAEKALRDSEENLRTTLYSIGDAVIAADMQGRILQLNPRAEQLTGWTREQSKGARLSEVFNVVDGQTREVLESPIARVRAGKQAMGLGRHAVLIPREGSELQLAASAAPVMGNDGELTGIVLVFRDVTAELQMQEELQKMQRLESVGLLAGGIAHDFNNIMAGLFGNIALAKDELSREHPAFESLLCAETAMSRAVRLTKQLLTFSKGGAPVKESLCLRELIEGVARFDLSGSNVALVLEVAEGLWTSDADKGQLQQVFSNMVINADQAMPDGGHLYISLRNAEGAVPGLEPGRFVEITVRDEGAGIAPADLEHVFDPYFSTKPAGKGLGLATSYSIISKHGGHIRVESQLGVGTSFVIHLRASEPARAVETSHAVQAGPGVETGARVLVMDDDELLRRTVARALERLGYVVELAAEGEQAIRIYREALDTDRAFSAVIMDLTIPGGMGGEAAAGEILEFDPDAVLIASSGYSDGPVMADSAAFGFQGAIAKPFVGDQLDTVLRGVLHGRRLKGDVVS
jgi:PAS domain S-box-containing protein